MSVARRDIFAKVSRHELLKSDIKRARALAKEKSAGLIFPAGSSVPPMLLVGRERQTEKLNAFGNHILGGGANPTLGMLLHGPRGTGKTVLQFIFEKQMNKAGALVLRGTGYDLQSLEGALRKLSRGSMPRSTTGLHVQSGGEINVPGAKASFQAGVNRPGTPPSQTALTTGEWLEEVFQERNAKRGVLISIDEIHCARPEVAGALMTAVQELAGYGHPVGFVFAGTPDSLDVLRAAQATWFLDRAPEDRLVGVGNLSEDDCFRVIAAPLTALGIPFHEPDLMAAAKECRGSPYFTQLLGRSVLEEAFAASQGAELRVDFGPDSLGMKDFRRGKRLRYEEAWRTLNGLSLTASARQIGALWRHSQSHPGVVLDDDLICEAITSGLHRESSRLEPKPSITEAERQFRHLGLLWSPDPGRGDWELGLPSFFDYVESIFQAPQKRTHHAILPELEADIEALTTSLEFPSPSPEDGEHDGPNADD